jgi:hypothetical protein
MTDPASAPPRPNALVIVALILAVGLAMGVLLSYLIVVPSPPPGPNAPPPGSGPLVRLALVFAGIDLVVLLALVFVYVRTYLDTRARFALGLVLFLAALTVQTVVGSPILFGALGYGPGSLAPFLLASYLFETVALTIFLALSLE